VPFAPSKAAELKSPQILRKREAVAWLLRDRGLESRVAVQVIDKENFIVGKVIDLLVEELVHAEGGDLYAGDTARRMAWTLRRPWAPRTR
jgi:hypothetical protein